MKDWDAKEWLIFIAVVIFGLLLLSAILKSASAAEPAKAQAVFDHSNCQYPDRSTNPADGCDNSDPCDPANVKGGGSGACTTSTPPQLVQDIPMSQNTQTGDKPVESVHKCE